MSRLERGCAMKAGTRQVLLLFKKGGSRDMLSPHDGDGQLHIGCNCRRARSMAGCPAFRLSPFLIYDRCCWYFQRSTNEHSVDSPFVSC
jgi:hypothetical protein